METYEKHDFDYETYNLALQQDEEYSGLLLELQNPALTHYRRRCIGALLESRRRELVREVSDFRGLSVLGRLATSTNVISDLFGGTLPEVPANPSEQNFDLGVNFTDAECEAAPVNRIGHCVTETFAPASFAARHNVANVLRDAKLDQSRRTASAASNGASGEPSTP